MDLADFAEMTLIISASILLCFAFHHGTLGMEVITDLVMSSEMKNCEISLNIYNKSGSELNFISNLFESGKSIVIATNAKKEPLIPTSSKCTGSIKMLNQGSKVWKALLSDDLTTFMVIVLNESIVETMGAIWNVTSIPRNTILIRPISKQKLTWDISAVSIFGNRNKSNVVKFYHIAIWNRHSGFEPNTNFTLKKRLQNFHRQEMRAAFPTISVPPHFSTDGINLYNGAELELVRYIAGALNFEIRLLPSVDGSFGSIINCKWNGMIGMIERGEADIAIGGITITSERATVVDFAWPFYEAGTALLSHVPGPLPRWQAIAWPFSFQVWIAVILTLLVFSLFLRLVAGIFIKESQFSFVDGFLTAFASMLQNSRTTNIPVFELSLLCWAIYCFLISAAYSGSLTSSLTAPATSKPLDTFAELAASSKYELRLVKGTNSETLFYNSSYPVFQKIARKLDRQKEKMINNNNFEVFMKNPWIVQPKDKFLSPTKIFLEYSLNTGETYMHLSREYVSQFGLGVAIHKGANYQEDFDKLVRQVLYFGLYKKWINKDTSQRNMKKLLSPKTFKTLQIENYIKSLGSDHTDLQPFSLHQFQGAFYILFTGLCLSLLAFSCEMLHTKCRINRRAGREHKYEMRCFHFQEK